MKLRFASTILLIAIILPVAALACSPQETNEESRFGVYLVETGELILSEHHIESYNSSSHEIELNAAGIEQWNSFVTSRDTIDSKISDAWLHDKHFVVKVNGEEIYSGSFWPIYSSTVNWGECHLVYFPTLNENFNKIWVGCVCPDPRYDWRILYFFDMKPEQSTFEIYLVETGESMISDQHIQSYNTSTHEIVLNEEGIEQWNSFATNHGCNETSGMSVWCLNSKQFAVKIDGEEIYRGSFVSPVSSTIPIGEATIIYYPWLLDDEFNTIEISYNCFDPRNDPRITDFFEETGLLK